MKKKILFILISIISILTFGYSISAGSYVPEDYYMDTEMINSCNIVYNANGGSFSDSSTKKTISQDVHLYFDGDNSIMIYPINTDVCEKPSRSGYKFVGWSNNAYSNTGVTGWLEYLGMDETETTINLYAIWEVGEEESFTIRFLNYDGTVLQTSTLKSGDTPIYTGETPTKLSDTLNNYTFKGWDKNISQVNGDCDYTATFSETKIMYSIGLTIKISSSSDMYFEKNSNQYLELYFNINESRDYNLTKSVIEELLEDNGYSLNFETEGYEFSGIALEDNGDLIESQTFDLSKTENITIYLNQKNKQVTIRFLNYDGTVLETKIVESLKPFSYTGETPTKPSSDEGYYVFKSWNRVLSGVASDTDIIAEFDFIKYYYTIRFLNHDGQVLQASQVKNGDLPSYVGQTPTKESSAQYVYTFNGWNKQITEANCDCDYTATYTESLKKYIIVFINDDGSILQDTEVEFGKMPSYTGETPTKESSIQYDYIFNGWNKEISVVTADCNYTATYTEQVRKYTIKFVNVEGVELQTDILEYGSTPSYRGETPTKESTEKYSYEFIGWDSEISIVTSDKTYSPVFSENEIFRTVNFYSNYGTNELISTQLVSYLGRPTVPESVVRIGYVLIGWSISSESTEIVDISSRIVKEDTNFYAVWERAKLTVKFHLQGGDEAYQPEDQIVEYGSCPITPEEPVREGYVFMGWLLNIQEPTEDIQPLKSIDSTYIWNDCNYYAWWEPSYNFLYKVTWKNYDDSIFYVEVLEYGSMPVFNELEPTRNDEDNSKFFFCGWSPQITPVKEDITYVAQFIKVDITYTSDVYYEDYPFYFVDELGSQYSDLVDYTVSLNGMVVDGNLIMSHKTLSQGYDVDCENIIICDFIPTDETLPTINFNLIVWVSESRTPTITFTVNKKIGVNSFVEETTFSKEFTFGYTLSKEEIKSLVNMQISFSAIYLSTGITEDSIELVKNENLVIEITYATQFYYYLNFGMPYSDYKSEDETINLRWEITNFEIIYNNDGSLTYKPDYDLNPKREGYIFKGWKDSSDNVVSPKEIIVNEPIRYKFFYAIWEKIDSSLDAEIGTSDIVNGTYLTPNIDNVVKCDTIDDLIFEIGTNGKVIYQICDDGRLELYFQKQKSNQLYVIQFNSTFDFLNDRQINDVIYEVNENDLLISFYLANNELILFSPKTGEYVEHNYITITSRDFGYVDDDDTEIRTYYIYFNSDIDVDKFLEMTFSYKYHYHGKILGFLQYDTDSIEGVLRYDDVSSQVLTKGSTWIFKNASKYALTDYFVEDLFEEGKYTVNESSYNYRMIFLHQKYEPNLGKIKFYGPLFGLFHFSDRPTDNLVMEYFDPLEVSYLLNGVEYKDVKVWDKVDIGTDEGNDGVGEDLTPVAPEIDPFDFKGFVKALIDLFKNGFSFEKLLEIVKSYYGCVLVLLICCVVLPILAIFFPFAKIILKVILFIVSLPFKIIKKLFDVLFKRKRGEH